MDGGQDILTDDTLIEHDGILIVVTLPWHVGNEQVTTQGELTILCGIALCQDVTLLHTLSLITDRTEVNGHILVGTTELRNTILLEGWLEADELLILRTVVQDTDGRCVNIVDHTITLSSYHRTRVLTNLLLNTCSHNRSLIMKQRYCLTHHVRSHQRTVSVIMLQERNEGGSDRGDLLGRDIDQIDI